MKGRYRNLPIACILAALLGLAAAPAGAIEEGDLAPDFTLSDMTGASHSLSSYAGDIVLLVFLGWDSNVSIADAPRIESSFHLAYLSQDVKVLGIDCHSGTREQITAFCNHTGASFTVLSDGEGVAQSYGLEIGSFVVVDASGHARMVRRGPGLSSGDEAAMQNMIEQLLREASNNKVATWGIIKGLYDSNR